MRAAPSGGTFVGMSNARRKLTLGIALLPLVAAAIAVGSTALPERKPNREAEAPNVNTPASAEPALERLLETALRGFKEER
jgi:hypothetical protein